MTTTTPAKSKGEQLGESAATWADDRYHPAAGMRRQINKVFPRTGRSCSVSWCFTASSS